MSALRLKSPALRLFTHPFSQAQIKENIKAPRYWPLWGEFTGNRRIPCTKASAAENASIFDDVIMKYCKGDYLTFVIREKNTVLSGI